MQISERDRPYTDGYWCGNGQGFNVYYSETSTTTLTLKKFITMDYIHFEVGGREEGWRGEKFGAEMQRRTELEYKALM